MYTTTTNNTMLFCDYYKQWITVYKEGAIRPVTMSKYNMAHQWLEKLIPNLTIGELDRFSYQKLLNDYAISHERQTTMDFHHHLKCAILDAVDEGLILRDPTRKAIIKGKTPRKKKPKYLNQYELHKLLDNLDLKSEVNLDWLILLIAKTGMRFSEALALTPKDFDLYPKVATTMIQAQRSLSLLELFKMLVSYLKQKLTKCISYKQYVTEQNYSLRQMQAKLY